MTFANVFDVVMLVTVLIFAIKGVFRGFSGEVFSLVGTVGGVIFALQYASLADELLKELFSGINPTLSWIVSLAGLFIAFSALCALLGTLLRSFLKMIWLSALDRIGGFAVGAAKGLAIALVLSILLTKAQAFLPSVDASESLFVQLANEALVVLKPYADLGFPEKI
ncbi:MAG: CvpA family protein [Pyramidobacter sp.]|nr:CvpA family protein [Pyramidobacter sp.]